MRLVVLTTFFFLFTSQAMACLSASQCRFFPIGITDKGLCGVETRLYRTEYVVAEDKIDAGWIGISYLKIYDKGRRELHSEILDTLFLFHEDEYLEVVNATFKKGIQQCKKFPDFTLLQPESIFLCDYQTNCKLAGLVFDTVKNELHVRLQKKKMYAVDVLNDTNSIASSFIAYHNNFDDAENLVKNLQSHLYLNSIRKFTIGKDRFTIVHIGSGQTFESPQGDVYPPGKGYTPYFEFNNLSKTVFEEDVLHHGHGFDFIIWE